MLLLACPPSGVTRISYWKTKYFSKGESGHILAIVQAAKTIVNVASVRHYSPFRYPGGKTWLVPHAKEWLESLNPRPKVLCEPFAGGAIVGLTAAMDNLVEKLVLIERDDDVADVWETIFSDDFRWLCNAIRRFEMTRDSVIQRLLTRGHTKRERAFQVVLRNRAQRGGILAPGASLMLRGEGNRGVSSRWYPETLAARIEHLQSIRPGVRFVRGDAFKAMRRYLTNPDVAWFVDPPYTAGGKSAGSRLYRHTELDHASLFAVMAGAAGPVMLTYDEAPEVLAFAKEHNLSIDRVPMKNTHHDVLHELVITKSRCSTAEDSRQAFRLDAERELRKKKRRLAIQDELLFPM